MSKLKSLRWHLITGNVGILISLLILFGAAIALMVSQQIISDLHVQYDQQVKAVNEKITQKIEIPANLLASAGFDLIKDDGQVNEQYTSAYFKSILSAFPYFHQIRLVNTLGNIVLAEPENKALLGSNVKNEPFFINDFNAKRPLLSSVYISSQTNKPMMTLSIPAGNQLIVCDLDISVLDPSGNGLNLKGFENVSILDSYGNYISDGDIINVEQRKRYPNFELLKSAASNDARLMDLPQNRDLLFSAVPVGLQKNWYLVATIKKSVAYESLRTMVLFIFFLLCATGGFSYYFLNRNLKKVNLELACLVESSLKFSFGEYDHVPPISHYREIQDLTDAFVEMAQKINEREYEINSMNEILEEKVEDRTRELVLSNQTLNDINALLEEEIEERQRVEDELVELNKTLEEKILERTLEITQTNLYLEETNAQLEEEIEERRMAVELLEHKEKALSQAVEEAVHANQSKRDFLANMSHEIRTPMNGILGMIEVFSYTEINDQQSSYLRTVKTAVYTLLNVLNDILDFSKIESGNLELRAQPFDLEQTFNDLKNLYVGIHQQDNVTFDLKIMEGTPTRIIGDEHRIRQILTNFITNAYKFTAEGSIRLIAEKMNTHENRTTLRLAVKDTGIGISDLDQKTLFHRFSQIENSLTKTSGGTGLGLAISKMLADLFAGSIGVISELGNGSEFFIICDFELQPLIVQAGEQDRLSDKTEQKSDLSYKRILIVEDDKTSQMMLKIILSKMHAEIAIAENGLEALKLLEEDSFDMILMDVSMPVMDGLQATRRIRQKGILSRSGNPIAVVAMTAFAMMEDQEACFEAGMTDYLSKPLAFDKLTRLLERL